MRPSFATLLATALAVACSDGGVLPAGPDPTTTPDLVARVVLDTRYSGILSAERTVIRSAPEWEAYWARLRAAGQIQPVATPAVDFTRSVALVASLGQRDRGGHDIDIPDVRTVGDTLVATVRLTSPGTGCSGLEVITTPLTIVTVSPAAPVRFIETSVVQDC